MKIEETFTVQAPVDEVWEYLTDPHRVAEALPGAELDEQVDEQTYKGSMSVKVGPMSASYKGTVKFENLDAETRSANVVARGQGMRGMGSAEMRMNSKLEEVGDSETRVTVTSDLQITGVLAQFGRGMIEQVSNKMFKEFTEKVREDLE